MRGSTQRQPVQPQPAAVRAGQYGLGNCALGPSGDPELDAASALAEMLFNGTTEDRTGTSFGQLSHSSGSSAVRFEFETLLHEGYEYQLLLSDDLLNWIPFPTTPLLVPLGDGHYVTRTYSVDPAAAGLDPRAVFGQLRGRVIQTP